MVQLTMPMRAAASTGLRRFSRPRARGGLSQVTLGEWGELAEHEFAVDELEGVGVGGRARGMTWARWAKSGRRGGWRWGWRGRRGRRCR